MGFRLAYGLLAMALMATGSGQAVAQEGSESASNGEAEKGKEKQDAESVPEFPAELRLDPERMPEPVRQNVLQRIDEHERLEELLRNQPLDIRLEEGTGE